MEYYGDHLECAISNLQDKLMSAQNMLNQEIAICEELKIERKKRSEDQCQKIDQVTELILEKKNRLKKSVTDNLETELTHLTAVMEMLQGSQNDALAVAERIDKIRKLYEVDMMEAVPLLTEDINAIYNRSIPSLYYTNIDFNTTEATLPAVDDILGKLNRTYVGKFQQRFNADLKLGKLHRSRDLKICDSSFRLVVKRQKGCICNSSFRRDVKRCQECENNLDPVEQLGVYFSIGDGDSTPVNALIRVHLLRHGLSHDEAMTEGRSFTFECPGSGDGWSRFITWEQVNDPEERFVSFGEMIFNISIAVKET